MTVTLDLEPELEQELQAQAHACGVTVQDFIHNLLSQQFGAAVCQCATLSTMAAKKTLNLPARNLGDMGSLHRREIYDDVR